MPVPGAPFLLAAPILPPKQTLPKARLFGEDIHSMVKNNGREKHWDRTWGGAVRWQTPLAGTTSTAPTPPPQSQTFSLKEVSWML